MTPSRETTRRLRKAKGYTHVDGWVPSAFAARVLEQIEAHREDVEAAARDAKPRGRPRKQPK